MGASFFKLEELEIDSAEAHRLVVAMAKVQAHYPQWDVPAKAIAWTELAGALAFVYGPRVASYRIRVSEKRAQQPAVVQ